MRWALDDSWPHRIFGVRIFHQDIWHVDKRTLANGASLGLFIAFTPTIPFQMLLCTVGAMLLRVNLPVALAGSFATNPVTAVPYYLFARRLGERLLTEAWLAIALELFEFESRAGWFVQQSLYLWAGCLVISSVAAVAGYLAVRALWSALHALKDNIEPGKRHAAAGKQPARELAE